MQDDDFSLFKSEMRGVKRITVDQADTGKPKADRQQLNQRRQNATARTEKDALVLAEKLGYPLVVRPSYVLGGRAMQIVYSDAELTHYMRFAVEASPKRPVLVDKFLEDATEVDVDCISDGKIQVLGAIMEHVEKAGIHSGDSACSLPPT